MYQAVFWNLSIHMNTEVVISTDEKQLILSTESENRFQ